MLSDLSDNIRQNQSGKLKSASAITFRAGHATHAASPTIKSVLCLRPPYCYRHRMIEAVVYPHFFQLKGVWYAKVICFDGGHCGV